MSRPWTFRALIAAVLLVFALAVCAVGAAVWAERNNEIQSGLRESRNVAIVLGGQLARSIQAIDIVLKELQHQIEADNVPDAIAPVIFDPLTFRDAMLQRLRYIPQAFSIVVTDARGQLLVSTSAWPTPDINVADREYFNELAQNDDDRLATPVPFTNRVNGKPTVVLARRLSGSDRRFLGVVFVSLSTSYFGQVYGAIQPLADQSFSLLRSDGVMFLRYPDPEDRAGAVIPKSYGWYEKVAAGGGSYRSVGLFDGRPKWVTAQPLRDYPFVVDIVVPEDTMLVAWRARSEVIAVATLIFVTLAIALLWVMSRQYRSLCASEASLADKSHALECEHALLLAHQAELRLQNERFDAALNNMIQGLAMWDRDGRLVVCNDRFREIWGIAPEHASPGTGLDDVIAACSNIVATPEAAEPIARDIRSLVACNETTRHEFTLLGGHIVCVVNQPLSDGGWLSTHEDVTDRRRTEAKIERLAHSDILTGIANRSHFIEAITDARDRLLREGRPFSVLLLDLDRFKLVNDSLGHAAGDALLKETAARLQASVRSVDVLARLGGDEFAIIQTPPRDFAQTDDPTQTMRESAIVLAGRIIELIGSPYDIDGQKVVVGTSIGIAMAPKDAVDADDLMKKADLALYSIKASGRNGFAFFNPLMAAEADERHRLETDFRESLGRDEFQLYYQPLIDVTNRRVCGMEALVRWNHPDQGLVAPDRFISMAEDTGLVAALGEWVLQTACAEAVRWPDDVKVAVNISPVQFRKTNLLDVIMCALVESGLSPERLEIEITERVLLEWEADHLSTLHQLKNLGVSIALDDFGTGYSSLGYLRAFPFDKIKIDRSFTRELLDHADCAAIICAITGLARSLDIVTVAEGVESEAQFLALRAAGVTQAQGYLIGRPVPAGAVVFGRDVDLAADGPPARTAAAG